MTTVCCSIESSAARAWEIEVPEKTAKILLLLITGTRPCWLSLRSTCFNTYHMVFFNLNMMYCYLAGVSPAITRPFIGYFMVTETLYRQMPWVGNITKTNDVKQETVRCYPLNNDRCCTWSECTVEVGLMLSPESRRVFCFLLRCINNVTNVPLGNCKFRFPRI